MKLELGGGTGSQNLNQSVSRNKVSLPDGLFGFAEIRSMELVFDHEELPFMWLREDKQDGLAFVVIEPTKVLELEMRLKYQLLR